MPNGFDYPTHDFVWVCWNCRKVFDEADLVVKKNPSDIDNLYCPDCDVAVMSLHKDLLSNDAE